MEQIEFKVVEAPETAKKFWDLFSPHISIDDEWNFRYIWGKYLDLPLHFIVGFHNDKPIGLLALQRNPLKGLGPRLLEMNKPFLEFFGGVDTDDNKVFLAPGYEEDALQFLEQIHEPAVLTSLSQQYSVGETVSTFYLDRFAVDLNGITDFNSYIDLHMTGKTRRNVKHALRSSKMDQFEVEIQNGDKNDLDLLFQFSINRFGEESSFHFEDRIKAYGEFFNHFKVDIFKIVLNNEVKAVVYGIIHNNIYTGINIGYDSEIAYFSKFIFTSTIERAIKLGCQTYDAGQGDNGWKLRLHLSHVPQYKLSLNL